jgi:sugar transferase EpsL
MYAALKLGGELLLAGLALIILLPSMVVISFVIMIESGWPVFVRHRCRGAGGKIIEVLKFRTEAPPRYGEGMVLLRPVPARPTRTGRILRRTCLDGLPMLLNVLNGDLAFRGPPPLPLDDARRYREKPGVFWHCGNENSGRK